MSQALELQNIVVYQNPPGYGYPTPQQAYQGYQYQPYPGNPLPVAPSAIANNNLPQDIYQIRDNFPPDVELARGHGMARRVAKLNENTSTDIYPCVCCGFSKNNELLSICCNRSDLSFLGSGLPLLFQFMLSCLWLIFTTLLVYGIYCLVSNSTEDACYINLHNCQETYLSKISLPNGVDNQDVVKAQAWLNFACILILMFVGQLLRRQQRIESVYYDTENLSPSDFTAYFSDLPESYTSANISAGIQEWWERQPKSSDEYKNGFPIWGINIAYDITDFAKKLRLDASLSLRKRYLLHLYRKGKGDYWTDQNEQELKEISIYYIKNHEEIENLEKLVHDDNYDKKSPVAFITFMTRKQLDYILETQERSLLQRLLTRLRVCCGGSPGNAIIVNEKYVTLKRAPEPSDVMWENCAVSKCQKYSARFFSVLASLVLLVVSFYLIYGVNKYYNSLEQDLSDGSSSSSSTNGTTYYKIYYYALSVLSSFIITAINLLLLITIRALSALERRNTHTKLETSLSIKFTFALFINTALIPLAANYYLKNNYIWSNAGLMSDIFWIMVIYAAFTPLGLLLDLMHIYRLCKRRKIRNYDKTELMTYGEANMWFEGPPFEISALYAALIKIMWMAGFYIPLLPILLPIAFGSIFLIYWTSKYLLLRRCCRPSLISSELNKQMMELLEYFPLSIAIGSWYFYRQFLGETLPAHYLGVIISCINFIIPVNKINKWLFKIDQTVEMIEIYPYIRFKFEEEYARSNPITSDDAIQEWYYYLRYYYKLYYNAYAGVAAGAYALNRGYMARNLFAAAPIQGNFMHYFIYPQPRFPINRGPLFVPPPAPMINYAQPQGNIGSYMPVNPLYNNAYQIGYAPPPMLGPVGIRPADPTPNNAAGGMQGIYTNKLTNINTASLNTINNYQYLNGYPARIAMPFNGFNQERFYQNIPYTQNVANYYDYNPNIPPPNNPLL